MKAGPAWAERGQFRSTADTPATSEYIVERLNTYPLAHWLLMGAMVNLDGRPLAALQGDGMFAHFRPRYHGTLIANVGMTRERGNQLVTEGLVTRGCSNLLGGDTPQQLAAAGALCGTRRSGIEGLN